MAGNGNEIAQIMKVLEKMYTRMDESDKKIERIPTKLQTLIKSAPKEKGDKLHNRGGEDDKKKEEKGETSTPQIDPWIDRVE